MLVLEAVTKADIERRASTYVSAGPVPEVTEQVTRKWITVSIAALREHINNTRDLAVKSGGALGSQVVDQLHGVMAKHRAKQGLLVAWGGLTKPAWDALKTNQLRVRVWQAADVVDAILDNYERLPDDIRSNPAQAGLDAHRRRLLSHAIAAAGARVPAIATAELDQWSELLLPGSGAACAPVRLATALGSVPVATLRRRIH